MTLPEAELSFYFAALAQLEPARRPGLHRTRDAALGRSPEPRPR